MKLNNAKYLFVYCSIVPHNIYPKVFWETAKTLSMYHQVLFVNLSESDSHSTSPKQNRTQTNMTLWRFNKHFSINKVNVYTNYLLLYFYIYYQKLFGGYSIILLTNYPEYDILYHFIPFDISILDVTDKYYPQQFLRNKHFINSFDIRLTNTELIYEEIRSINPKTYLTSSGYSYELQLNEESPVKLRRSVVFFGGISHRLDYDLLEDLVKHLPDAYFIFIGDMYLNTYYIDEAEDSQCLDKWKRIINYVNVRYFGMLPRSTALQILSFASVGIIPYATSDVFNYYSHPIKIYEYLSRSIPVVSTEIPSVSHYKQQGVPIYIAKTSIQFLKLINTIINTPAQKINRNILTNILNSQSINTKVQQILSLLSK